MVINAALKHDLAAVYFIARVSLYKRYCGSLVGMGWSLLRAIQFWAGQAETLVERVRHAVYIVKRV